MPIKALPLGSAALIAAAMHHQDYTNPRLEAHTVIRALFKHHQMQIKIADQIYNSPLFPFLGKNVEQRDSCFFVLMVYCTWWEKEYIDPDTYY